MNENNTAADVRLAENEYIRDLFGVLRECGRDTGGLSALLDHVGAMEGFVKRAEDRIADMKAQLDSISEIQHHPLKAALQKAITALEAKVTEIKACLSELKENIAEGCKNAVAAFRERGVAALDNIAAFLHIKQGLQAVKNTIVQDMSMCDKSIADIGAFAKEYHSAGRAIKNMARVAAGKKPVSRKKAAGRVAKMVSAPYMAHKAVLSRMKDATDKAIGKLTLLENTALEKQEERQLIRKPSLLGKLEANKKRVALERRERPMPERAAVKGAEI